MPKEAGKDTNRSLISFGYIGSDYWSHCLYRSSHCGKSCVFQEDMLKSWSPVPVDVKLPKCKVFAHVTKIR